MEYPQGPGEQIATGTIKNLIPGYGLIEKLSPYLDQIKQYLGLGQAAPQGRSATGPLPNASDAAKQQYYAAMAQQGQPAAPHIPPIGGGFSGMQLPGGMGQVQAQPQPTPQPMGVLGAMPNYAAGRAADDLLRAKAGIPATELEGMPVPPSAADKKRSKGPDYNMGSTKKGKK